MIYFIGMNGQSAEPFRGSDEKEKEIDHETE